MSRKSRRSRRSQVTRRNRRVTRKRRTSRRTRRRTSHSSVRRGGHLGHDLMNVGGECALKAGQYIVDVGKRSGRSLFQVISRISAKQSKIAKCALGKKLYGQSQRLIYNNCKKRKVSKILRMHKVRRPSSVY